MEVVEGGVEVVFGAPVTTGGEAVLLGAFSLDPSLSRLTLLSLLGGGETTVVVSAGLVGAGGVTAETAGEVALCAL